MEEERGMSNKGEDLIISPSSEVKTEGCMARHYSVSHFSPSPLLRGSGGGAITWKSLASAYTRYR